MPFRRDYQLEYDNTMKGFGQCNIRDVALVRPPVKVQKNKTKIVLAVKKSPRAPKYEIGLSLPQGPQEVPVKRPRPGNKNKDGWTGRQDTDRDKTDQGYSSDGQPSDRDMRQRLNIIACNKADGLYYPGHLEQGLDPSYGNVEFNFKKRQKIRTKLIIPIGGAVPKPALQEDDFVLVRVYNGERELECYVPGIIQFIPEDQHHHAKFYSVLMYNGQLATTMRKSLVKIGRERFQQTVNYISQIQADRHRQKYEKKKRQRHSRRPRNTVDSSSFETLSSRSSSISRSKSRSKSRSRSRSRSTSKSRSRSRSQSSSRSRSRSSSSKGSRSDSRSRSRSRSKSRSRSRSRSRSSSRSRSPVITKKKMEKKQKAKARFKSSFSSRPNSDTDASIQKSESELMTSSRSTSRSRSESPVPRVKTPSPVEPDLERTSPVERPPNPVPDSSADFYRDADTPGEERTGGILKPDEKEAIIGELEYQLEKQKRKQLRQERRLVRQARKLNRINQKLKEQNLLFLQSERESRLDRSAVGEEEVNTTQHTSPPGSRRASTVMSQVRDEPRFHRGQEVLARWQDDGWYYRGVVLDEVERDQFRVRDATGYTECIAADDILTEDRHPLERATTGEQYVVALHPKYVFSYAPGQEVYRHGDTVKVKFFDEEVTELSSSEVYPISPSKYVADVRYIERQAQRLVGVSVVARDDRTGFYKPAWVDNMAAEGQCYHVHWKNGNQGVFTQNSQHLFPVSQPPAHHDNWKYVLAPTERGTIYLPGQYVNLVEREVELWNGTRLKEVPRSSCLWISKEYYQNAVEYIHARKYKSVATGY